MEHVVSATEARVHLGKWMRRAAEGEVVIVARGGKPYVVMLSVETYLRLRGERPPTWEETLKRIQELRAQIRKDLGGRPLTPPPEEVIRAMREERDAQIMEALLGDLP